MKTKQLSKLICASSISALFLITNFALADEPEMYNVVTDNLPSVGVSTTKYLGDRLLAQRVGMWADCITPKFSETKAVNGGLSGFAIVKADISLCKTNKDAKFYHSPYPNAIPPNGAGNPLTNEVAVETSKELYKICVRAQAFGNFACFSPRQKTEIDVGATFIMQDNSLQQTIEYSGKSGNILKFIYAEYKDDYARQAFNREFTVDLTEGNIVAYKGAIIEVEKATNAEITYKVIRNFQQ